MATRKYVTIVWHDDLFNELGVVVSIDEPWNGLEDDEDDEVFFYFANEAEYQQAKEPGDNGFEFQIIEEE